MNKPDAILFDWDNTLVNSWPIIIESLHQTFLTMGHEPWSEEEVRAGREGIHHSLRDSFPRIFGDEWEKARDIYYQHFLNCHLEKIEILEGALDTLELLKNTGIYLAIVSNKTGKYLRKEAEHLNVDHYFSKIIGAMDAEEDKPSAKPALLALEGSNIKPGENVWFIGDSETDIQTAHNARCKALYFGDGHLPVQYRSDNKYSPALPHFRTHQEFQDMIKTMVL